MREGAGEPLSELLEICFMMFKATRPRDAASGGASSTGPCKNLIPYKNRVIQHGVPVPPAETQRERAGRKGSKSRPYICFRKMRWDEIAAHLGCQPRRPHTLPNQHAEAELKLRLFKATFVKNRQTKSLKTAAFRLFMVEHSGFEPLTSTMRM